MKKNKKLKNMKLLITSLLCLLTSTLININVIATKRTHNPETLPQTSSLNEKIKEREKLEKQTENPNQKIYDETNHTKATSFIERYTFDKCKKIFDYFEKKLKNEINKSENINMNDINNLENFETAKKIEKQTKNLNQKIYDETNHTKATSFIERYTFDKCKKIFDYFEKKLKNEINKSENINMNDINNLENFETAKKNRKTN